MVEHILIFWHLFQKKDVYRKYSHEKLMKAYEAVSVKNLSVSKAAKLYKVPEQTLRDRIRNKVSPDTCHSGPKEFFSKSEEDELARHLIYLTDLGYPQNRNLMRLLATGMAEYLHRPLPPNNRSGEVSKDWVYPFLERHADLAKLKIKKLAQQREHATSSIVLKTYYTELERILRQYDLIKKPELIFSLDETGFNTDLEPSKPVVEAGSSKDKRRNVFATSRSATSTTTLIAAGNAKGKAIPPFVVFKGDKRDKSLLNNCYPGTQMIMSPTGWSNKDVFMTYINTHFLRHARKDKNDWVLLLYDGHASHITPNLYTWCKLRNIVLFVLPAHSSHSIQPLDVTMFGPMKIEYTTLAHDYVKETEEGILPSNFCEFIATVYDHAMCGTNITDGFTQAGIYPFPPKLPNSVDGDHGSIVTVSIKDEPLDETHSVLCTSNNSRTSNVARSSKNTKTSKVIKQSKKATKNEKKFYGTEDLFKCTSDDSITTSGEQDTTQYILNEATGELIISSLEDSNCPLIEPKMSNVIVNNDSENLAEGANVQIALPQSSVKIMSSLIKCRRTDVDQKNPVSTSMPSSLTVTTSSPKPKRIRLTAKLQTK